MGKCAKCEINDTFDSFDRCKECITNALGKSDIIINNLLAYVNSYRKRSTKVKLLNACIKFFLDTDIICAKVALYDEYNAVLGTAPRRNGSYLKDKSEFNLEDILDAFTALDRKGISVICASSNVNDLPKFNPEELDLSSILDRITSIENKLEEHGSKLDENYAHLTKNKSEIENSKRNITSVQNEVQTSINLANETRVNTEKQGSDFIELKNKIESGTMPTYATAFKSGLSNARNVTPQPNLNGMSSTARRPSTGAGTVGRPSTGAGTDRRPSINAGTNRRVGGYRPPARYGTTNATGTNYNFGMPLPSRYVVIERVTKGTKREEINDYIKWKNSDVPIRAIKFMSKSDSYYERLLIEVSLEHISIVKKEDFWPEGVRVRDFRGNGRLWKDTHSEENITEEETE